MRSITGISLSVLISCAIQAGCYGNLSPTGATTTSAGARLLIHRAPQTGPGLIFSSSYGGNSVDNYLKGTGPNNPVAGSLAGNLSNPQGMGVDEAGDLYVTNSGDENVLVYAGGSTSATGTLNDPNRFPEDVAIAPDGTVYVGNVFGPMGPQATSWSTRPAIATPAAS